MKPYIRVTALLLALVLLLSCTVNAADLSFLTSDELEHAPDFTPSGPPDWTETELTISSGSFVLAATLTIPGGTEPGEKTPIVILAHGLNSNRTYLSDVAWKLADQGIASIRFDMGGCGDSSGESTDMTVATQTENVVDVLEYARGLSWVDTDQVFLFGKSMGGIAVMLAASGHLDEIAGIALWYPALVITDGTQHGYLLGTTFNAFFPPATVEAFDFSYSRKFIRQCQCLQMDSVMEKLNCPVLILHGDKDVVVPISYSTHAAEVLPDCTMFTIYGGIHGFYGPQELVALQITGKWFADATGSA